MKTTDQTNAQHAPTLIPLMTEHPGINSEGIPHGLPFEFKAYPREIGIVHSSPVLSVFGQTEKEAATRFQEIVRACNSHDALVAALEAMLLTPYQNISTQTETFERARAALAKAKGQA